MPFLKFSTPSGPIALHYSISTPNGPLADNILPHLPTILFLHSVYVAQAVFQCQFSDRRLRRFNLIAVDMRAHGETRGLIGNSRYTPTESADDVFRLIEQLKVPRCHIFGLSIGCSVALELASSHPDRIQSLTLCSPLTPTESEDITLGRIEVTDYWLHAAMESLSSGTAMNRNHELVRDAVRGIRQLLFDNKQSTLITALTEHSLTQALRNWSGSREKTREGYKATVLWLTQRRPMSLQSISLINCPVSVIHCTEDFAYPIDNAQDLVACLREAGLAKVQLTEVVGPHYGNVTNPEPINQILYQTVLSSEDQALPPPLSHHHGTKVVTPFSESLAGYGYHSLDGSDSDWDP